MEERQVDTSALKFGNSMLNSWLRSEPEFWKFLLSSIPCQICMISVYGTLVRFGELVKWDKFDKKITDANQEVKKWCPDAEGHKLRRLSMAVIVLTNLAESRLKQTSGV